MTRLDGKTAFVTGGNSGIGRGTVRRLVQEGAFVFATGRNQEKLDSVAAEFGDRVEVIRADSTSRQELSAVMDRVRERHGTLDIVFANAGAAWYGTIDNLSPQDVDRGLELDVKGTISTVQAALPLIPNGGSIIVNTSITQDMGLPTYGVYAAAKAGLRSLVRTWVSELRDRNIRVNAISPGTVYTEAYEKDMGVEGAASFVERVVSEIPVGRIGQPEDIGNAVVFLASADASFVNGIELVVDGGQTQVYQSPLYR